MSFPGKHYASIYEKKRSKENGCTDVRIKVVEERKKSYEKAEFDDDGRYLYYKDGGGLTSLIMHMNSCI